MYAYDRDAMVTTDLDPFRVDYALQFAHTHEDTSDLVDADTLTLTGPRGAEQFARMYALYRTQGICPDILADILAIPWGYKGTPGQANGPAAQSQIRGILRWLLACAGYGEDILQDAFVACLEEIHADFITVGDVIAITPWVITQRDWHNSEPLRSSVPFEWLS